MNIKNTLIATFIALGTLTLNAQTNAVSTNSPVSSFTTNGASDGKEYGGYELTLGGGGTVNSSTGKSEIGLDFTLSSNPFKKLSNVWIGIAQSVAWTPAFSGSTDLYSDWNSHIWKELYLNTGWSVGAVYDTKSSFWRTGPEVSFEYYTSDNAFLYAGVNYDFANRNVKENNGWRFSWGIGLAF